MEQCCKLPNLKVEGSIPWCKCDIRARMSIILKFIYSEKATKFCEMFTLLLFYEVAVW